MLVSAINQVLIGNYWNQMKILRMDEAITEVEGLTFRAPTTSQEDHNTNFIDHRKKKES